MKSGHEAERSAEAHLEVSAIGYASAISTADQFVAARDHLRDTALLYAASKGELHADERSELQALRAFRDGVLALRAELTAGLSRSESIETIDALFKLALVPLRSEDPP